ncbi:MAG: transposase [Opitutaceae bacterium]
MARKPRIQFAGALYHVINRGNFRQDLFSGPGTAQAFEKALFETCERCGWELGAYCVMRNHFHLALATPKGNLVEGMQWLQSTFGNRFNSYFSEQGHVFQGRYKSILVEPGDHWLRVINYIHLNPVRAGLVTVANLESHSWSSFPKFLRKKTRPPFLQCGDWLPGITGQADTPADWRRYRELLDELNGLSSAEKEKAFDGLSQGTVLGTNSFRRAVWDDFKKMDLAKDWGGKELRELNEIEWEVLLKDQMKALGKTEDDVRDEKKSAEWKAALAWSMKKRTSVGNRWLGEQLNMGPPAMVSRLAGSFGRSDQKSVRALKRRLTAKRG